MRNHVAREPQAHSSKSAYRIAAFSSLSILTAMLLLLVFPRFDVRWLAPVALTPLLWVVAKTSDAWHRFPFGWAAGIVYWFFICNWIQFVLEAHGDMGFAGSWASFLLFAVLKGLHMGLFAALAGPLMRRSYAVPAVAALWTGLERTHATFGFAWLDLGNAGIEMALPLRLAPLVGVYGLSFVFAAMAAGLACVLLRAPRTWLLPLLALGGLWFLPAVAEIWPATERAAVVQPNIDTDQQWTQALQESTEERLSILSNALAAPLVIWPELPAPLYYYDDPAFRQAASAVAQRHGAFLFGTVAYDAERRPMNTALLLGRDGDIRGRYDKIQLVPFGEFVPAIFSWVNRITHEAGDFTSGDSTSVLTAGKARLGTFICYEAAFPALVREFAAGGANVLVNLSNDGYFGHSEARQQHLLIARMRAVENRRFLIRSTNDGITAVVNPAGRIVQRFPLYQQLASVVKYATVDGTTFYSRHGDWFAWTCLVAGLVAAGWSMFKPLQA